MKAPSIRLAPVCVVFALTTFVACREGGDGRATWDGGSSAAPLGAWVGAPGYELRAIAVRTCSDADAGANRRRVALEVEIKAVGDVRVPVNAFYARLVDGEGREEAALVRGCEPMLRGAPLRAHETARGLWTFELASPPRRRDLVYRPRLLDPALDTTVRIAAGSL